MNMSTIRYSILLLIVALAQMGCTKKNVQPQQMETYYSSNKSFRVDIPTDYNLYKYPLPNYIGFTSERQHGVIIVERKSFMGYDNGDFEEFIEEEDGKMPKKFRRLTVSKNDSICHYKYASGLFVTHRYFMRKLIEGYSYVVDASGTRLDEETAKRIYESIDNN